MTPTSLYYNYLWLVQNWLIISRFIYILHPCSISAPSTPPVNYSFYYFIIRKQCTGTYRRKFCLPELSFDNPKTSLTFGTTHRSYDAKTKCFFRFYRPRASPKIRISEAASRASRYRGCISAYRHCLSTIRNPRVHSGVTHRKRQR